MTETTAVEVPEQFPKVGDEVLVDDFGYAPGLAVSVLAITRDFAVVEVTHSCNPSVEPGHQIALSISNPISRRCLRRMTDPDVQRLDLAKRLAASGIRMSWDKIVGLHRLGFRGDNLPGSPKEQTGNAQ